MKIWVNDEAINIPQEAENLLEALRASGIEIPSLCYVKGLSEPPVPCGMCVVEIEGRGIVRACATKPEEGLRIKTDTETIKNIRRQKLEALVANHYGDCKAPCHGPCPGGINIQGYIAFIARGEYASALSLIKEKLPLPALVGRVCPRFCEPRCRRALVDVPVGINNLKRFVADWGLKNKTLKPEISPSTGKKVAIVGAGPAGLTCAYFLRLKGHDVTIFEARDEPGGMPRWAYPDYKIPKDILRLEIDQILELGVELRTGKRWGYDFAIEDLFNEGFSAVFLAIGSYKCRNTNFPGEEHTVTGLSVLYQLNSGDIPQVGKKVLVLGGGYTAIDVARSLLRLGADVTLVYPRSRMEMPAPQREVLEAEKEGVHLFLMAQPLRIAKEGEKYRVLIARTRLSSPEKSKARKVEPVPGTEKEFEYDFVVRAWGEEPDIEFKKYGKIEAKLAVNPKGIIKVATGTQATNIPGVWAGGDFVSGPKTVIQAVASGRRAAENIDKYLREEKQPTKKSAVTVKFDFNRGRRFEDMDLDFYADFPVIPRERPGEVSLSERKNSFKEIYETLSEEAARKEAERCLKCGCLGYHKCSFRDLLIAENVPATKGRKRAKYKLETDHFFIEVDSNKCVGCYRCVRVCQYGGIELTIFAQDTPEEEIHFSFTEDCVSCGACVDACPTGALTRKDSSVPFVREEAKVIRTVCPYCGTGCNVLASVKNESILEMRAASGPPNYGDLCVKGRFGYQFYRSPERLKKPLLRESRDEDFREVSWEEALDFVAERLRKIKDEFGPDAIGVLCSARTTNEDTYVAQKFARAVIGTHNVDNPARV